MKKLLLATSLLASSMAHAATAYYSHEVVSGMSKICYYKYAGSSYAITIKSYQVCPVSINV